ncbi:MAG: DUF1749 domain-containing protein [Patescibacteria group bacterium]
MAKVTPRYVSFRTKDGLNLPGLLYEPRNKKTAAIYLHGNGTASVFYNANEKHSIGQALLGRSIATLYFNNRGAHLIKNLDVKRGGKITRQPYGMAYEKIKECLYDIDAAINFLKKQGYTEFILIGSSTGANKICIYNYYRPHNEVKKYVLLSAGDDVGIFYDQLGKNRFEKLLKLAARRSKTKQANELMPELYPQLIFSNAAFFDTANPDGDYNVFPFYEALRNVRLSKKPLFRHFKSIKKPTLVVFGDRDEYAWNSVLRIVEILKTIQSKCTYTVIRGADHGFAKHEKEMAKAVMNWLLRS